MLDLPCPWVPALRSPRAPVPEHLQPGSTSGAAPARCAETHRGSSCHGDTLSCGCRCSPGASPAAGLVLPGCLLGWKPGRRCPTLSMSPGSWSSSQLNGTKHSRSLWAAPPVLSASSSLGTTTQGRVLHQAPSSLAVQLLLPQGLAGPWLGRSSGKEGGEGGCHRSSRKAPK